MNIYTKIIMDISEKNKYLIWWNNIINTAIANWRYKLDIKYRRPELRDKDWLYDHYVNQTLSAEKIAAIIGCSGTAVQQYLSRYGIPIRDIFERQRSRSDR